MRKTVLILVVLLSASINYMWSAESSEEQNIKIEKGNSINVPEIRPRSLVEIPVSCYYSDGFLYFTFLEDLGEVEVSVANHSTGTTFFSECNTIIGSLVVNVPIASGNYLIQIVTEDGDVYYGEYTL